MASTACIQVVVTSRSTFAAHFDVLGAVAKITNLFLEARWAWPRKFTPVSQTAYLLSDPRDQQIDPTEIQQLSTELQAKLFGVGEDGEVMVGVFEGAAEEAMRFANLSAQALRALLTGQPSADLKFHGRLLKITQRGANTLLEPEGPAPGASAQIAPKTPKALHFPSPARVSEPQSRPQYRGIYMLPSQQFIGNFVSRQHAGDLKLRSLLDGPAHFPVDDHEDFDRQTIGAVVDSLAGSNKLAGVLFMPLSYSALVRPSTRKRYLDYLKPLTFLPRDMLMARVYDVPRMPQTLLLTEIADMLHPYFGMLNLSILDPGFDFDSLPPRTVRGVTLVLPSADDVVRRAALKRFMSNHYRFRSQRLWPIIGNVRTRGELQLCGELKAAFVCGPAVTDILDDPLGVLPFMLEGLPVRAKADTAA